MTSHVENDGIHGHGTHRTAMASLERSSPSMFLGQSWSSWADKVTNQEDEGKVYFLSNILNPRSCYFILD